MPVYVPTLTMLRLTLDGGHLVGLLVSREGCPNVGEASEVHPGVSGAA